jgi:hypothetical protein
MALLGDKAASGEIADRRLTFSCAGVTIQAYCWSEGVRKNV